MTYWFGSLPHGWEAIKLKYLVNLRQDEPDKKSNYIGLEHIEQGTGNICGRAEHPIDGNAIQFNVNDVLFGKLRPYLRKVWIADFNGCASKEILVMQPLKINAAFLFFVLLSHDFIELVNGSTFGAKMPRSDWSFIGNQFIPVPPKKIQERIANNLKLRLGICNQFILENQDKLNRLSEYRQSLITQAVTKGLDPNVEMKDSGVEWIGHIPQSWSVPQVKYLFSVVCGATPSPSESNWGGDIAWIGPSDMEDAGMIDHGARFLTSIGYKSCGTELVPVGSLILSTRAPIGKVAYACRELCTNQGCKSLVPRQNIETKYFYYVLQAMRSLLEKEGSGTTFMELSTSSLGSQKLPLPSNKEQIAIADYLDKKLKQLQITLDTTKKSIDRLTEYRTSLISAAVTGKIDINEVK